MASDARNSQEQPHILASNSRLTELDVLGRAWRQAKLSWAMVKKHPVSLLLPPLIKLALFLGFGIWAVMYVEHKQRGEAKASVLDQASTAASAIKLLMHQSYTPALTLAAILQHQRSWPKFAPDFPHMASTLYQQAPAGYISSISVYPNGINAANYPEVGAQPSSSGMYVGLDTINTPGYREDSLRMIAGRNVSLALIDNPRSGTTEAYVVVPLFVGNVTADEDFGMPPGIQGCGDLCYNAKERTKFFGFTSVMVDLSQLASFQEENLAMLVRRGYRVSLQARYTMGSNVTVLASTKDPPPLDDSMSASIELPSGLWTLYLYPSDGWESVWLVPALVAVIFISFVASFLLFCLLLSRREHKLLLEALVPKSVITRTKDNTSFIDKGSESEPVRTGTTADTIIGMMEELMEGRMPEMKDIVLVRNAIMQCYNLYEPLDLRQEMAQALDTDVARALMNQLGQRPYPRLSASTATSQLDTNTFPTSPDTSKDGSCRSSSMSFTQQGAAGQSLLGLPESLTMVIAHTSAVTTVKESAEIRSALASAGNSHDKSRSQENAQQSNERITGLVSIVVHPASPVGDELTKLLATAEGCWQFDAFQLDAASSGHGLSCLGYYLMCKAGLIRRFSLSAKALARFLCAIEAGYKTNPYHNREHASDVLQTFHIMIHRSGLYPHYVDPLTHLACYLAAIVHDYEHMGVTNDFLVNSGDPLAVLYNDHSPMENHHLAAAFALMKQPDFDFLGRMSKTELTTLRKTVIDLVLGTDMKQHFTITSHFSSVHRLAAGATPTSHKEALVRAMSRPRSSLETVRGLLQGGGRPGSIEERHTLKPVDEAERMLSLKMALKCADLGHLVEGLTVHKKWVARLECEFFLQGDKEKDLGIPVSPLFDRNKPGVTKSQVGFFSFVAIPLFQSFTHVFHGAEPAYKQLMDNYAHWEHLEQDTKSGKPASEG